MESCVFCRGVCYKEVGDNVIFFNTRKHNWQIQFRCLLSLNVCENAIKQPQVVNIVYSRNMRYFFLPVKCNTNFLCADLVSCPIYNQSRRWLLRCLLVADQREYEPNLYFHQGKHPSAFDFYIYCPDNRYTFMYLICRENFLHRVLMDRVESL